MSNWLNSPSSYPQNKRPPAEPVALQPKALEGAISQRLKATATTRSDEKQYEGILPDLTKIGNRPRQSQVPPILFTKDTFTASLHEEKCKLLTPNLHMASCWLRCTFPPRLDRMGIRYPRPTLRKSAYSVSTERPADQTCAAQWFVNVRIPVYIQRFRM
jgi:hypothetical protein